MATSALQIINTIRDNSSADFIARVPQATRDNLTQVGDAITADKNIMNEFMSALINKVAMTYIKSKMYKNPLARLKKGTGRPLGATIEEIFINPSIDQGYSTDGNKLLKTTKPDGKACYFGLNRKSTYAVTINKQQLQRGFQSENAFSSLLGQIVNSLYSGDQIDEFQLMKNMVAKNIDDGNILKVEVDIAQPKELSKAISNMSDFFTFPSTKFAPYNLIHSEAITGGETACTTFCPTNNQVLLIRADVLNEINYEVLASMFHMEVAEFKNMVIKVDDIPCSKSKNFDCYAVLTDIESINVIDDVFQTDDEYIGSSMQWNIWLHHFQWLYLSSFGNSVAFGKTTL